MSTTLLETTPNLLAQIGTPVTLPLPSINCTEFVLSSPFKRGSPYLEYLPYGTKHFIETTTPPSRPLFVNPKTGRYLTLTLITIRD